MVLYHNTTVEFHESQGRCANCKHEIKILHDAQTIGPDSELATLRAENARLREVAGELRTLVEDGEWGCDHGEEYNCSHCRHCEGFMERHESDCPVPPALAKAKEVLDG